MLDNIHYFSLHVRDLNTLNVYQLFFQRYGINLSISKLICTYSGIHPSVMYKADLLNIYAAPRIREFFSESVMLLDKNLKKIVSRDVAKLIKLNNRRGMRFRMNLPVRGQRTSNNAMTARKNMSFIF